jgi:hypothetical protein
MMQVVIHVDTRMMRLHVVLEVDCRLGVWFEWGIDKMSAGQNFQDRQAVEEEEGNRSNGEGMSNIMD